VHTVCSSSAVTSRRARSTLFPYPTLFRSTACCYAVQDKVWVQDSDGNSWDVFFVKGEAATMGAGGDVPNAGDAPVGDRSAACCRSEEHTSELQSREDLVCRLLLEKKNEII